MRLDHVFFLWHNKAAGSVSYRVCGALRAVEQSRQLMAELPMAATRTQLSPLSHHDFETVYVVKPADKHTQTPNTVFDEVFARGTVLTSLRRP